MASPYTPQSISGYNTSPPADDGSQVASNRITWAGVKTKLNDPIKTLSEAIDTAVTSAFTKVLGGVGVTSTAISYTVLAADQGKLVRATASSITVTTPDATDVGAPFVFALLNNSGGTITFDGNGSQTIDGSANVTVAAGSGMVVFTDGSNWFTTGQQGTLVGKQLRAGDIINGTITESNVSNAVTFSLKTLAGNDPSATDPVLACFRSPTSATGIYVYRTITAATTLTITSGSTLGFTSAVAGRVWLVLFDDAGTVRLGAINCRSGTNVYPLGQTPVASSTAEGGAGGADSAQVFYTGTAVTSKAYNILGYATYDSGLATAGTWNVSPDVLQVFGDGIKLPGNTIQITQNSTGAVATGTTATVWDDTIPTNGEGDEYMTQAIFPLSASNILRVEHEGQYSHSAAANQFIVSIFQDSGAALASSSLLTGGSVQPFIMSVKYSQVSGTTSTTTFKVRAGGTSGATTTFNGSSGSRKLGGVYSSYLRVTEIMA